MEPIKELTVFLRGLTGRELRLTPTCFKYRPDSLRKNVNCKVNCESAKWIMKVATPNKIAE